jgi:hypothetical protein
MFLTHWFTLDSRFIAGEPNNPNETEHLFRNDSTVGNIVFTNVSEASGVTDIRWADRQFKTNQTETDFGFTPTFAHINGDEWPDILLASDFGTTQAMTNNGDFTFTAVLDPVLRQAQWGMGSALGDIDNDGDLDWFVTSIRGTSNDPLQTPRGNRLFLNEFDTGNEFTDVSVARGVDHGSWGCGACFLDIDNDADLDIFHTNGWPFEFLGDMYLLDTSRAFVNNGAGSFTNNAAALGLAANRDGRGVVCADFDNDGDTDILQLYHGSPGSATMWRNDTASNNSLVVKLIGLPPNTEAAGARIHVATGTKTQMREIMIGNNFVSQNPTIQVFGLGTAAVADNVTVEWPDGMRTDQGPVTFGQTLILRHPDL